MQRRHDCSGFTLFDVLMVALILAILGTVAVPHFKGIVIETTLNEAAAEFVCGLQYAQNLAVEYQRPFGIKADAAGNWFSVFDDQYKADPNPHHGSDPPVDAYGVVREPLSKSWYVKNYDTIYQDIKITAVPTGGEIRFYSDGHSSNGTTAISLNSGEKQKTIFIDGNTGVISVN